MPGLFSVADSGVLITELANPIYNGLTNSRVFERLNAPETIANPVLRGKVPTSFDEIDVMVTIPKDELKSVISLPLFVDIILPLLQINNKTSDNIDKLNRWTAGLLKGGIISSSTYTDITTVFNSTRLDPAWQSGIPGPTPKQRLFGNKTWLISNGCVIDFIPLEAVAAARGA